MNPPLQEQLGRYPHLEGCVTEIEAAFALLCRCYERDGVVYLCSNGGSAADAGHIAGELMKSFLTRRKIPAETARALNDDYLATHPESALRAVALTGHGSLATAIANDIDPELVFARQAFGYGRNRTCRSTLRSAA